VLVGAVFTKYSSGFMIDFRFGKSKSGARNPFQIRFVKKSEVIILEILWSSIFFHFA
jgi:hypothetical protein